MIEFFKRVCSKMFSQYNLAVHAIHLTQILQIDFTYIFFLISLTVFSTGCNTNNAIHTEITSLIRATSFISPLSRII